MKLPCSFWTQQHAAFAPASQSAQARLKHLLSMLGS
jgi:hypothetical protein